jgi:translation elongation factor EF-1alpha
MEEQRIGVIEHYYPKVHAAVVDLRDGDLHVGDEVHITGKGVDFVERVKHLEIDHERVDEARRGQHVGLEVTEPVKAHIEVFAVAKE